MRTHLHTGLEINETENKCYDFPKEICDCLGEQQENESEARGGKNSPHLFSTFYSKMQFCFVTSVPNISNNHSLRGSAFWVSVVQHYDT